MSKINITPAQLAAEFSRRLVNRLTPEQLESVRHLNAGEQSPSVCHSHDYCDANVYMDEAFLELTGQTFDNQEELIALWNEAWSIAKASGFAWIASERTGHTPGPWRVEQPYTKRNVFPISHEIYKSNCRGILAEVNAQGGNEIETSANARLIAAAPELLETLKSAVRVMERQKLNWEGEDMLPHYRNVIAKAEGAI